MTLEDCKKYCTSHTVDEIYEKWRELDEQYFTHGVKQTENFIQANPTTQTARSRCTLDWYNGMPKENDNGATVLTNAATIVRDYLFGCPALKLADALQKHEQASERHPKGIQTFMYYFEPSRLQQPAGNDNGWWSNIQSKIKSKMPNPFRIARKAGDIDNDMIFIRLLQTHHMSELMYIFDNGFLKTNMHEGEKLSWSFYGVHSDADHKVRAIFQGGIKGISDVSVSTETSTSEIKLGCPQSGANTSGPDVHSTYEPLVSGDMCDNTNNGWKPYPFVLRIGQTGGPSLLHKDTMMTQHGCDWFKDNRPDEFRFDVQDQVLPVSNAVRPRKQGNVHIGGGGNLRNGGDEISKWREKAKAECNRITSTGLKANLDDTYFGRLGLCRNLGGGKFKSTCCA